MKNMSGATRMMSPRVIDSARLVVQYRTRRRAGLPHRRSLERWAGAAVDGILDRAFALTIRFVDAGEGRALNRRYRGKDHATNVLTFSYGDGGAGGPSHAGDIVLCASVVAKEARVQGKALGAHYAHLVVHGLLHLQGHDHERPTDALRMEAREREILAGLGYSDPYAQV